MLSCQTCSSCPIVQQQCTMNCCSAQHQRSRTTVHYLNMCTAYCRFFKTRHAIMNVTSNRYTYCVNLCKTSGWGVFRPQALSMHHLDEAPASGVPCTHGSHVLGNPGAKQVCSRSARKMWPHMTCRRRQGQQTEPCLTGQKEDVPHLLRRSRSPGANSAQCGRQPFRTWLTSCSEAEQGRRKLQ